jgi:hypothetical protein
MSRMFYNYGVRTLYLTAVLTAEPRCASLLTQDGRSASEVLYAFSREANLVTPSFISRIFGHPLQRSVR